MTADHESAHRGIVPSLVRLTIILLVASGCTSATVVPDGPYAVVLGVAQDGGYPQAGCNRPHCEPGWDGDRPRGYAASLAIVDPATSQRWLIEATPHFAEQLRHLDRIAPSIRPAPALDGIFLTHAHIGHYAGLIQLGREVIGSEGVPVHVMPRMRRFLESNGPWSQLVELGNIRLVDLEDGRELRLNSRITIEPFLVPHRDEFSETVGFLIRGPDSTIAWLPDIDKWSRWDRAIEDLVSEVDVAYLDGTFFANGEIARDMSEIPHPFIVESIERLRALPIEERKKVRFIHLNHTNPALDPESVEAAQVREAGFAIAAQSEITPL